MDSAAMKPLLIELIRTARAAERGFERSIGEAERAEEGTFTRWSAKDVIASLAAWKRLQAQKLVAASSGEVPPVWRDDTVIDPINAQIYEKWRARPWREVSDEADRATDALIQQVEVMVEEQLADPNHYSWQGGEALWRETLGNGLWYSYSKITEFYTKRGDTAHATIMLEELDQRLLQLKAHDEIRALSAYNLACFKALRGLRAAAFVHLEQALGLSPMLVAWSKHDSDLASLREDPAFQALCNRLSKAVDVLTELLITGPDLHERLRAADMPTIIDVRSPVEYRAGHVPGARNIPLDQLLAQLAQLDQTKPIVTYCNMYHPGASRGERAAALLREHGCEARALDGGFPGWKEAGHSVEQ